MLPWNVALLGSEEPEVRHRKRKQPTRTPYRTPTQAEAAAILAAGGPTFTPLAGNKLGLNQAPYCVCTIRQAAAVRRACGPHGTKPVEPPKSVAAKPKAPPARKLAEAAIWEGRVTCPDCYERFTVEGPGEKSCWRCDKKFLAVLPPPRRDY